MKWLKKIKSNQKDVSENFRDNTTGQFLSCESSREYSSSYLGELFIFESVIFH